MLLNLWDESASVFHFPSLLSSELVMDDGRGWVNAFPLSLSFFHFLSMHLLLVLVACNLHLPSRSPLAAWGWQLAGWQFLLLRVWLSSLRHAWQRKPGSGTFAQLATALYPAVSLSFTFISSLCLTLHLSDCCPSGQPEVIYCTVVTAQQTHHVWKMWPAYDNNYTADHCIVDHPNTHTAAAPLWGPFCLFMLPDCHLLSRVKGVTVRGAAGFLSCWSYDDSWFKMLQCWEADRMAIILHSCYEKTSKWLLDLKEKSVPIMLTKVYIIILMFMIISPVKGHSLTYSVTEKYWPWFSGHIPLLDYVSDAS